MKLSDFAEVQVLKNYRENALLLLQRIARGPLSLVYPPVEKLRENGSVHLIDYSVMVPIDSVRAAATDELKRFIAKQEEALLALGVTVDDTPDAQRSAAE